MQYTFNAEVATQIGVDEAIMLENIHFWVAKNKANEKNFYDGEYWTYNSVRAFSELFPFWSTRQIERILKSLEKQDCIKVGNYNKVAYDRTKWYALTDKAKSFYAFEEFHLRKRVNRNTKSDKPIPYNKPNNKPYVNQMGTKEDIVDRMLG